MKKICIFLDYYNVGGIEKVINDIYYNLKDKYIIDIITFSSPFNINKLLKRDYKNFFIRNIIGLFKYNKYLKNNNYDIIHINCYNSFGFIYAFFAKKYINKIIIHAHNSNVDKDIFYIKRLINNIIKKLFYNNKYILISLSDSVSNFCFGTSDIILLPNGVDYNKYYFNLEDRKYYRNLFSINDNEIVIGAIGRFEKQKNYSFIIDILKELDSNYKLILIGNGSLLNKINKKIKSYNLTNRVIILNYRDDINRLINMFDIYIQPSLYEGFGLSIVENEINGKLVLVSNNIDKIIKISNKIYFLPLDIKLWINKIKNFSETKLILNNKLDLSIFINKIDSIYESR